MNGSHPSWVCGLKRCRICASVRGFCHTLRGCVDWNRLSVCSIEQSRSHTLRGCVDWNVSNEADAVSKSSHTLRGCVDWNILPAQRDIAQMTSHPSWVCGLKLKRLINFWISGLVTPFVGVWIETLVLLFRVCTRLRHTLRGCVDWNYFTKKKATNKKSHTLRGCVDWNISHILARSQRAVTPFVGVWIETLPWAPKWTGIRRHTLRGCVDWNKQVRCERSEQRVTPFVGVWIETG